MKADQTNAKAITPRMKTETLVALLIPGSETRLELGVNTWTKRHVGSVSLDPEQTTDKQTAC